MRALMLSEAEGTLEWNIALVGMCHDEEALMLHRIGRSQDKKQPLRNLVEAASTSRALESGEHITSPGARGQASVDDS